MSYEEKRAELIELNNHMQVQHGVSPDTGFSRTDPANMDEDAMRRWSQRYHVVMDRAPENDAERDILRAAIAERQDKCLDTSCTGGVASLRMTHAALYKEVKDLTPPRKTRGPIQEITPDPLQVTATMGTPGVN